MLDVFATQVRVIWIIVLRDMHTRFGKTKLGYLWAIITPLSYAGGAALLYTLMGRHPPLGESMVVFFVLGFLPFFLFRNIIFRMTRTIESSQNLLTHPGVMPNDVVLAKALVESATMLIVAVIVFGILAWQDLPWRPHDPAGLLVGVLATILLGTGMGAVGALIALFIRSWDRASRLILRPFFLVSAVMFLTDSMPETFRNIIVWNPLLHCIEWIRESFYSGYVCQSLDRFYPILVGMGCLCFALAMERLFRRRIYEMVRS